MITDRDLGKHGTMIASGEDSREQGEIFLVFGALRYLQRIIIGVWHAQVVRLSTGKRSPSRKAIGSASETRIDGQTVAAQPALTVFTEAARYITHRYNTVTFTQGRYSISDLLNNAHRLMAESEAPLTWGSPLLPSEISTTNPIQDNFKNTIITLPYLSLWPLSY